MASFMSNIFAPGGKDNNGRLDLGRPSTPVRNSFVEPASTPQGSPSKRTFPPGAHDLPQALESHLKLNSSVLDSPIRLGRPQSVVAPLSPTKINKVQPSEPESTSPLGDESILQRAAPSTPLKHQGQENTPPTASKIPLQHSHAALSRQDVYNSARPAHPPSKFETSRGLTQEERDILEKPNVRRLVNVTQLCKASTYLVKNSRCNKLTMICTDFLDYYFDLLTYVGNRQTRLNAFQAEYPAPPETEEDEYKHMWHKYTGRERANLRKRRVRLRQGDFQILTQVGQGGYGQVFLAQKKDTKEVCALKVMSKKLLFKLDEVRHVLTERDILTTAKSQWLVRLLYSFQDDKNIYLAMVCRTHLLHRGHD